MLTTSKSSEAPLWPSLEPTKKPAFLDHPTSSYAGQTASSRVRSSASTSSAKSSNAVDTDDDDELAYAPRPNVSSESFGTAIAQALMLNNYSADHGTKGNKKKKKNRSTVLFSMGGRNYDGN